jgi:hypothetical protein
VGVLLDVSRVQTISNCQAIESTIGPINKPIMPCTSVPPRTPINITGIGVLRPLATSGRRGFLWSSTSLPKPRPSSRGFLLPAHQRERRHSP